MSSSDFVVFVQGHGQSASDWQRWDLESEGASVGGTRYQAGKFVQLTSARVAGEAQNQAGLLDAVMALTHEVRALRNEVQRLRGELEERPMSSDSADTPAEAPQMAPELVREAVAEMYRRAGRDMFPSEVTQRLGIAYEQVLEAISGLEQAGLLSARSGT